MPSQLWTLFLWWFYLTLPDCASSREEEPSSNSLSLSSNFCFPYVLENECTLVLGNVTIDEREQQFFFDENVSLTVSDVRMVRESCRRSFLSFYCQIMFGGFLCESLSEEEESCFEEEYCLQVAETCSDQFRFDCSSLSLSPLSSTPSPSPSPSPSPFISNNICQEKVKEEIEKAEKKPIPVVTCINEPKEEINCCLEPFIFDDNDECVVQCPQFVYGERWEMWGRNILFASNLLQLFVFITSMIPLSSIVNLRYPNSVIFLSFGCLLICSFISLAGFFAPISFLCQGKNNYLKALDHFAHAVPSLILFSLFILFNLLSSSHWTLFAFNMLCNSVRPFTSSFEKFIHQPVKPTISIFMEGIFIGIPLSIFFTVLIYGSIYLEEVVFVPLPCSEFPWPSSGFLFDVYSNCLVVFGVFIILFLAITSVLFAKRGRQILYFQWRSFFAGWFSISVALAILATFYFPSGASGIRDYYNCVASHPRLDPSPCERVFSPPYLLFFFVFLNFSFLFVIVVFFWTNPLVLKWWRDLICSKENQTSPDYEEF